MEEKILNIIDEKINPKLLEDQGWIELADVKGKDVYVRFRGACSGCVSNEDTLNNIVKPELKKEINEIENIFIVNDVSEELINLARSILSRK